MVASYPKPFYHNHDLLQFHYWQIGNGRPLLVLPGLLKASASRTFQTFQALPCRSIVCLDLPGLGGTANGADLTESQRLNILREFVASLGDELDLLVFDLQITEADELLEVCDNIRSAFWIESQKWEKCVEHRIECRSLDMSWDGTHLVRLWNHIRDIDMLHNGNPRKIGGVPEEYMSAEELDAAIINFGVDPSSYERYWNKSIESSKISNNFVKVKTIEEIRGAAEMIVSDLSDSGDANGKVSADHCIMSSTTPRSGTRKGYVELPRGRAHVLCRGSGSRLLLALMAGPGSSSSLQPVLDHLGEDFFVVAPDYIGQGKSPRHSIATSMAELASDAADIAELLGFEEFFVYGTHTGAGVAIELAIKEPAKVQRLILDGVVMRRPKDRVENSPEYFPELRVDNWGSHLLQCWNIRRDGLYFYPWFRRESEFAQHWTAPKLPVLHDRVICSLRSRTTPAYQVAICDYDATDRLRMINVPTLCVAGPNDAFFKDLQIAKKVGSNAFSFPEIKATIYFPEDEKDIRNTVRLMLDFLNET